MPDAAGGLHDTGADSDIEPAAAEDLAQFFPQLEIVALLGRGGMGAVYKARQPALDRWVALKILPAKTGDDAGFAQRFDREARALARLNHPNIVALHDFGQAGELRYFIMEYVDGASLRQLLQAGRLSPREALRIIPQICEALQYAHDEGVVHRDIKPENVLVDRKGRVKIADFGLAKILGREPSGVRLTVEGQMMGTPHYMAPEQVEHPQAVDHRADIYSLGVVFYELLTGELPLGKFQPPSQRVFGDARLDDVVLRALEKEPDRRYQQANEVKTDVEVIATTPHPPAPAPVPVPQEGPGSHDSGPDAKRAWRHLGVAALAAVVLAGVVGLGGILWRRGPTGPRATGAAPVTLDTEPPAVLRVRPPVNPSHLVITFSEPVTVASAEETRSYSIGGVNPVRATLDQTGTEVTLELSQPLAFGSTNMLTVQGIEDQAPVPNVMPRTEIEVRALALVRGFLRGDYYTNLIWNTVAHLTGAPRFPDFYDRTIYRTNSTVPWAFGDNYGLRLWGFFIPPTNGSYTFYVRSDDESAVFVSTDQDPANKVLVASQTGANRPYDDFSGQPRFGTVSGLIGGKMYYFEAMLKEAEGEDYLTVVYKAEGEEPPVHNTPSVTPVPASSLACYADAGGIPVPTVDSPSTGEPGIPPRDPQTSSNLVDLSLYYNAALSEDWHDVLRDNHLGELPTGVQTLAGTPFDVRGLIQVCHDCSRGKDPPRVDAILVGQRCQRLHFLHAAIDAALVSSGTEIGRYVVHFANGEERDIPLVLGQDLLDWARRPEQPGSPLVLAWEGENPRARRRGRKIYLYKTTWENPLPAVAIDTVDFMALRRGPSPFLIALTAE